MFEYDLPLDGIDLNSNSIDNRVKKQRESYMVFGRLSEDI